jgi:hypothetical protein
MDINNFFDIICAETDSPSNAQVAKPIEKQAGLLSGAALVAAGGALLVGLGGAAKASLQTATSLLPHAIDLSFKVVPSVLFGLPFAMGALNYAANRDIREQGGIHKERMKKLYHQFGSPEEREKRKKERGKK